MADRQIVNAIVEQLTVSYMQACRVVPQQNLAIVAASLADALDFSDVAEVRAAFKRARMNSDIPTQRFLSDALNNVRQERMPAIPHERIVDENSRPLTFEERQYIFAYHHINGIKVGKMTDEEAERKVKDFEADRKNARMVTWMHGHTHDIVEIVDRYGLVNAGNIGRAFA